VKAVETREVTLETDLSATLDSLQIAKQRVA